MEAREHLMDWLKDAHGMEMKAVELLEKQAERLEGYPEVQEKVREHKEQSRSQAERLEHCLDLLDSSRSWGKDLMGRTAGNLAAMGNAMASDEIIKNCIGNCAFEHFEIACYKSLIETAGIAGELEIVQICKDIMHEEQEMAEWMDQHLPSLTKNFLEKEMYGVEAKR
jgi:ferritin-like metal-binding protein YciE